MIQFRSFLPFLKWPRLSASLLRSESLAGLTVGLMVIPQSVAYAALAGMPLVTGIYASVLPALVGTLFSGSSRLSIGPTALTCLLIGSSLTGLAEPASIYWINLAVCLALLTGLVQIALGAMRFGWLINVVSAPVLMAFTQAAGVLILASQLPALLGLPTGRSGLTNGAAIHWPSAVFGMTSLLLLVAARQRWPNLPTVLIIVLAAAAISAGTGFETTGGHVIGYLPTGLPSPYLPTLPDPETLSQLLLPTFVITLVSFLETASCAKVDNEGRGQRWEQDQDLIGQGLAKVVSGLCGAFPTSSSFSRSALNLHAGALSGWATIAMVAFVLTVLLFFTPVLRHVPNAVLAAIVIVAVLGLIRPTDFLRLWRISTIELVIAAITFCVTILAAPKLYWGILTGVLLSLCNFLYQRLHPRVVELGLHADGTLRDRHQWQLPALAPHLYAMRLDAALDFASASTFELAIQRHLASHPDTQHICLFAQPINRIDATGVEALLRVASSLHQRGIRLHVVGMKLAVEGTLRCAGGLSDRSFITVHRTDHDALKSIWH
jgi:SulP family sulfate permease